MVYQNLHIIAQRFKVNKVDGSYFFLSHTMHRNQTPLSKNITIMAHIVDGFGYFGYQGC